ncbi:MAG: Lipopolysaccharide export system protein LptC [Legionellaceae bacterium]
MRYLNIFQSNNKQKISSLVLFLIAMLSAWLIFEAFNAQHTLQNANKYQFDAFMEEIRGVSFNEMGNIDAEFYSSSMKHYPNENITEMENPLFYIYDQENTPWKISAQKGKTRKGVSELILWNHVVGFKPKNLQHPATKILTNYLFILPEKKYAQTNSEISTQQGDFLIKSEGANIDLNKEIIKLSKNVRSTMFESDKKWLLNASKAYFKIKNKMAVYEGNVIFSQDLRHLYANQLSVYLDSQNALQEATALGKPAIIHIAEQEKISSMQGNAEKIQYLPKQNLIVFKGNVNITQDHNNYKSPYMTYNMKKQTIKTPFTQEGGTITIKTSSSQ